MGRNSEEPYTMCWKREGGHRLLRKPVFILPAIPGKQDQYSGFFFSKKYKIIWYENDKAKRINFFSFLTIKKKVV